MVTAEAELKQDLDEVLDFLLSNEPSLATRANAVLVKALVLAGASEIEVDFQQHIIDYYADLSGDAIHAAAFVEKKAVKRQYHTYFSWDKKNANQFFGLFGACFAAATAKKVGDDPELDDAIKAFLELGNLRNELVHENFAAYSLSKTASEVHDLCIRARRFVDQLPALLRTHY